MTKRRATVAIVYLLAGLMLLGGFAIVQTRRLEAARLREQRGRELALEELYAAVAGLDTALEKSRYALSPELLVSLCAECRSRSQAASAALGVLPLASQEVEDTAAFFSRAGDYTDYLLRKLSAGAECTAEERSALGQLSDCAGLLEENLARLRGDVRAGAVGLSARALEESLPSLSKAMVEMEGEFPEFPTLVYDGPFSAPDPAEQPPLSNAAEISRSEALLIGAGFLGTRPNLAECLGRSQGELPVWQIRSGDYTAHVSVHGGHALRILCSRPAARAVLTAEDAREKAREHLESRGFRSMGESYYSIYGNIITVTYCYERQGVRYYPDMVKVSVYLDNGELAGLDAESYVRSHGGSRERPPVSVSAEEARGQVSPELTVLSEGLAVIPTAGGAERLCHEFICENAAGQHYLLYVNAATGVQERILILLEDDNGTLAI